MSRTFEFDELVITADTVPEEESNVKEKNKCDNNTNVVNDIASLVVSKAAGTGLGMFDNAYDVAVKIAEKEVEVAKEMHSGYLGMKEMGYNIKGKGGGTGYLKKQIGKSSKKLETAMGKKLAIKGAAEVASKITFGVGIGIDIAVDQAFDGKTHSIGRSITTSTADAIAVLAFSNLFMKFGKNIPFFGWPLVIGMVIGYGIGELSGMIYDSLDGGRDVKKDDVEVKVSLILRYIFSFIVIFGTYLIIIEFISYERFEDYYHNNGIKWTVILCLVWPALILVWNNGLLIDKNGIHTWIGFKNTKWVVKVKQSWNEIEVKYYPSWPFPSVGVDKISGGIICKHIFTNFDNAVALIGKYGFEKIVRDDDKKFFLQVMKKYGIDRDDNLSK